MIEITKQEALVLAAMGYSMLEANDIENQELENFLDANESVINKAADLYGIMSVEDTSSLVLKMFKKGIEND